MQAQFYISHHIIIKETFDQNCVVLNYCRLHLVCTGFLRLLFCCAAAMARFLTLSVAELYFSYISRQRTLNVNMQQWAVTIKKKYQRTRASALLLSTGELDRDRWSVE